MVTRTRSVHYLIVQQQQQKRMIKYGLNISFLYKTAVWPFLGNGNSPFGLICFQKKFLSLNSHINNSQTTRQHTETIKKPKN